MTVYRIVSVLTEKGASFSIAVSHDGAPERRLPMLFGSRVEAEKALKNLQSGANAATID